MSEPTAQQRAGQDVAISKETLSNNVYIPPVASQAPAQQIGTQPNVCPGCGRCGYCGKPYHTPYQRPFQVPDYPYYPYYQWGGMQCGSTTHELQPNTVYLNAKS